MIETGGLNVRFAKMAAMGDDRRTEQGHVGKKSEGGAVNGRVVRQCAIDPDPQRLGRLARLAAPKRRVAAWIDWAKFDRADSIDEALDLLRRHSGGAQQVGPVDELL